jgi:hypothetical protein
MKLHVIDYCVRFNCASPKQFLKRHCYHAKLLTEYKMVFGVDANFQRFLVEVFANLLGNRC